MLGIIFNEAYFRFFKLQLPTHGMSSSKEDPEFVGKECNRPLIHFTPKNGWMNDPNGLFYDEVAAKWHLYYQFNPNDTVWGLPLYWGHATSNDLTVWEEHKLAIGPDNDYEGIFSGSIVIDKHNSTGFFDDSVHPCQRIVAIYTNHSSQSESQYIAYSIDGGYTFSKYHENPVLDVGSTQFRDPKCFWHEDTKKWIMVVVKSQEYKIQIFSSSDLKKWEFESNFSLGGYLGFQYECPGLSELPIVDDKNNIIGYKWVMFLAINPGGPLGGSFNQYFIGDFDGSMFTPDDHSTRFMDMGKDFYAFQSFVNSPDSFVYGIAWASNWQYAAFTPTHPWRSSMSITRKLYLKDHQPNPETTLLTLVSEPIVNWSHLKIQKAVNKGNFALSKENPLVFKCKQPNSLLSFKVSWKLTAVELSLTEQTNWTLNFISSYGRDEFISLGYDPTASACFINRGNCNEPFVKENPFFTDKMSCYLEPVNGVFNLCGILDKNILELFFNDSTTTSTNTVFLSKGNTISDVELTTSKDGVFEIVNIEIEELTL